MDLGEKTCVSPAQALGQLCDLGQVTWPPLGAWLILGQRGINCIVFFMGLFGGSNGIWK